MMRRVRSSRSVHTAPNFCFNRDRSLMLRKHAAHQLMPLLIDAALAIAEGERPI